MEVTVGYEQVMDVDSSNSNSRVFLTAYKHLVPPTLNSAPTNDLDFGSLSAQIAHSETRLAKPRFKTLIIIKQNVYS